MFGRTTDESADDAAHRDEPTAEEMRAENRTVAHQRFGGINWGAAFFGWLVAIAMTVLLAGIVSAVAAAVGEEINLTQADVEAEGATAGLVAGDRRDRDLRDRLLRRRVRRRADVPLRRRSSGTRPCGSSASLVTILAVVLGLIFGEQYNVLDRVNPPDINTPEDAGIGAIVAGVVLLVVTALTAMAGGKAGRHYHTKVDATRYPV